MADPRTGQPAGLAVRAADPGEVAAVVAAVLTATALPATLGEARYLYAAYAHGYDIAHRDGRTWVWGSRAYAGHGAGHPATGPEHGLDEIRIFGADAELRITRLDEQEWTGWWRRTGVEPAQPWLRPRSRDYLVTTGQGLTPRPGFTRIEHGSGQFAVLPFAFTTGHLGYATTREYFTADPDTGAVRVAAVTWTGYRIEQAGRHR